MLRFKSRQREVLVEKIPDLANLVVGSTFLGQFLTERPFSLGLALGGITTWMVLMIFTLFNARSDSR